jgi:hypothetical protein
VPRASGSTAMVTVCGTEHGDGGLPRRSRGGSGNTAMHSKLTSRSGAQGTPNSGTIKDSTISLDLDDVTVNDRIPSWVNL